MMGANTGLSITTAIKLMANATLKAAKQKKMEEGKGKTYNLCEIHPLMG